MNDMNETPENLEQNQSVAGTDIAPSAPKKRATRKPKEDAANEATDVDTTEVEPKKRVRRTKAQIEADNAAMAAGSEAVLNVDAEADVAPVAATQPTPDMQIETVQGRAPRGRKPMRDDRFEGGHGAVDRRHGSEQQAILAGDEQQAEHEGNEQQAEHASDEQQAEHARLAARRSHARLAAHCPHARLAAHRPQGSPVVRCRGDDQQHHGRPQSGRHALACDRAAHALALSLSAYRVWAELQPLAQRLPQRLHLRPPQIQQPLLRYLPRFALWYGARAFWAQLQSYPHPLPRLQHLLSVYELLFF